MVEAMIMTRAGVRASLRHKQLTGRIVAASPVGAGGPRAPASG